jgi:hypothetical protein
MSTAIRMPTTGTVSKIHRKPGQYVGAEEPVVDLKVGIHILTISAPFAGKVMRCRDVGAVVQPGEQVVEVTGVGTETWGLFIAYRRADDAGNAGRVGDRLRRHFGPGQVFKDVDSLPIGVDFPTFIRTKLRVAFAMVVIIGPRWASDPRLHDPNDLHREEIRTALERGIYIVPVLVGGAAMPRADGLPADIRSLVYRNAVEITETRVEYDTGILINNLDVVLDQSPKRLAFLAQLGPWTDDGPRFQWVVDNPNPEDL